MNIAALWRLIILLTLVVLTTLILALPVFRYLKSGWNARRNDIMDALSPESSLRYFEMFARNKNIDITNALPELDAFYIKWYGKRFYAFPVILLMATALIVIYLSVSSALALYVDGALPSGPHASREGFAAFTWIPIQQLGLAAQAGAYMWVVNDLTSRARRLDLAPSDVHWGVLRLVIALPLGCFMSQIIPDVTDAWRSFIAFGIGAFPLSGLLSMIRRITLKRFGMKEDTTTDNDIIKLQGINAEIAERLANEGITTITQMAYCDPIRITMRSSLSFNFIIDCMGQALAWIYLESKLNTIRSFGLRGAVEINHLYRQLNDTDPDEKAHAESIMNCVAEALNQKEPTLEMVFFEIAYDPFTEYLSTIWEGPKKNRPAAPHPWRGPGRGRVAKGKRQNGADRAAEDVA
ncbi:hypothetical protein ACFFJT_06365 [Dyella flava]|uniref:Uncharacterized protein n=1 Tax=Dyella flava TaxID=1920170 RepID=A0ABS2K0S8_9GAMM|nr:hypothetical protein [Dyella flava]MBM7124866.1 hypothetical protein [Dyella flava]GLQ50907.1 hypothetical protein GCM10010872_23560 [Dyella flava]